MKVLLVSHYFYPEPNFFACLPFAKLLLKQGHDVEVLTGFPHYPHSKLHDGYKTKLIQREVIEGIKVVRVPVYPSHDKLGLGRIMCYLTFLLSACTIGLWATKKADVVVIGEGPGTMGLYGCVRKLFRATPYVIYILDLWPETLESTGMSSLAIKVVGKMMDVIYKFSSKVIVCTPGYKRKIEKRGVRSDKVDLVYAWCNEGDFSRTEYDAELAAKLGMEDKFNVVFAGNMGTAQALSAVVEAASVVEKEDSKVQFWFVGDGVEVDSLKNKAKELGVNNVRFIPRQPISEIGKILNLADVLLIHLKDDDAFKITIPSKTVASMIIGKPLLVAVGGDTACLVEKANAGINCNPEDPDSIADAIIRMRKMPEEDIVKMGENGRQFYLTKLAGEIAVKQFTEIFQQVTKV